MTVFDPSTCPLDGVNLIEASAGTGKTYALACLFLRLMVEQKLSASKLLVITFTKAATTELQSRIRRMITDAQNAFRTGLSQSTLISNLLEKYPTAIERKRIIRLLNDALANFDETAIYTIHGFCQRLLTDNAFASGTLFETELIANQKNLEKGFVGDFWRRYFYGQHPVVVQYALENKFNQKKLLDLLHMILSRPDMKIIPDDEPFNPLLFEETLDGLRQSFSRLKNLWLDEKDMIAARLSDKALTGQIYGEKVDGIIREVDAFIQSTDMPVTIPDCLSKLNAAYLKKKTKNNQTTPRHAAFDLVEIICSQTKAVTVLLDLCLLGLKKVFLESAKTEFPGLKKKKNILYFDDLLTQAHLALSAPEGHRLIEILRGQYAAVLIDEFQDTDPIQYAILQTIFLTSPELPQNPVFYIGDPKQAIYSFRGADIYAYLRAAKSVDRKHTMEYNWRSEASLINAVNVLFENHPNPFVYDEIPYVRVKKAPDKPVRPLKIEGEDTAGLRAWFLPQEEEGKPKGVGLAREEITQAVVTEIAKLLRKGKAGKALIGDEPLAQSDIAVLVRKNAEAITFKSLLSKAGIAAVVYSAQSVFTSEEAHDLRRLMLGMIHEEHEGYLLAALTTPFYAYSKDTLAACSQEDDLLEGVRIEFKHLYDLWQEKGFLSMFMRLTGQADIRVRIVSKTNGERRLTNYTHLAQLLFDEERQEHLQPSDLLRRFEEMMLAEDSAAEDQQQKLETDRDGVRIITIHKSKGLEYPVVFCPFAWEAGPGGKDYLPVCFHDEKNNWQAIADLGSEDLEEHKKQSDQENLAEDCRLLYVALTRAVNRCYLVLGNIQGAKKGAATYLFGHHIWQQAGQKADDQDWLAQMNAFARLAPDDIKVTAIEPSPLMENLLPDEKTDSLHYRPFEGHMDQRWKIASYSYLVKAGQDDTEWDEETRVLSAADPLATRMIPESILLFPPGVTSGNLLHDILEKIDFTCIRDEKTQNLIEDALERFNYSAKWRQPIENMLGELVKAKLEPRGTDAFSLSEITSLRCRKEMEFYFPLQDISPVKLMPLFDIAPLQGEGQALWREQRKLYFPQVAGFLKGFIDLVFEYGGRYYLADWKSNHLGDRHENYIQEILKREMHKSFYDVQYLIYSVALHLYLKKRLPGYTYDQHFGGVYYFFLRGIHSKGEKQNGIYYDLPDEELIRQLEKTLTAC